jgi:hypothetical protein
MELIDQIKDLYLRAEEILKRQEQLSNKTHDNTRSLEKLMPDIIMVTTNGAGRIEKAVNDIPKHVHVTQEYGLNKHTKILAWAVIVTILSTAAMVIWLMPKAEFEYIQYQQTKIREQEEKLDYFISRNPVTLKAWNKSKAEK